MNKNLILKTITATNGDCPEFVYKNPLLDKKVAKALSKSFVKILNLSNQNSKFNNNLRLSVLENIRRMCSTIGSINHVPVDEELVETLTELYRKHTITACSTNSDSIDKQLDIFLVQRLKEMDIHSSFNSTQNLEIMQALINLNSNDIYLDILSKDIVSWHLKNGNYMCIMRDLWDSKLHDGNMLDSIALKMKADIEKLLLHICLDLLNKSETTQTVFERNSALNDLVQKCTSPICFQMCVGILNFIFIMSNFEPDIRMFISTFVSHIKANITGTKFLYPVHLNHLVVLLDFDINLLPDALKPQYITPALNYLRKLHEESESDFILLLSHYPQWFDIYYNEPAQT